MGGGYCVYLNGKKLIEVEKGPGRGQGGKPRGAFITKDMAGEFGGEVTIAATGFLRYSGRYKGKPQNRIPRGRFSVWLEKMKIPPMDAKVLQKSAIAPMRSTETWHTEDKDDRFHWDGEVEPNPKVLGSWKKIDTVAAVETFAPGQETSEKAPKTSRFAMDLEEVTFKNKGLTDHKLRVWSGNTFMNLKQNEALAMQIKTLDGDDYLFIEAGGFGYRVPKDYTPPYYVYKRVK
jgi:hypothetical protein